MKKKIGIGIVLILFLGIGFLVYYFRTGQKAEIVTTELTERSKEHIERQKKEQDDQLWRNVQFEKKRPGEEEIASQMISLEGCFEFLLPFYIAREHSGDGGCRKSYAIENPNGRIVVSLREVITDDIGSVPDVMVRRTKPEEYEEVFYKGSGYPFVTFKKRNSGYEKSAFYLLDGEVVTISITTSTNENLDPKFDRLLDSFRVR